MKRIVSIALLLFWRAAVSAVVDGAKFDGTYQLQSFVNETGSDLTIPAVTRLVLTSIQSSTQRYNVHVTMKKGQKRGNTLSGKARIRPATGATSMGTIVSTRMFTPFLAYEAQLAEALEATTNTTLSSNGVLLMKGNDKGSMKFRKVAAGGA